MRRISLDLISDDDPWCPVAGLDGNPINRPRQPENPQEEALLALVGTLEPKDRALLYSLYWDRKSLRQLEQELGVHNSTILRRRDRIIAKLRKELDGS